jgi:hypothetical protein
LDAGGMGLKKSTAIARALTDCGDLEGGQFFQLVEADFHIAVGALPAQTQFPASGVNLRNVGQMIAHKKFVVGGDGGAQISERRLVIGRPVGQFDQWLFAGQCVENGFRPRSRRQQGR